MFTVVAVDAKLEPLLKDYLPLYETAREEQIRMIRWNRQGGSVQSEQYQPEGVRVRARADRRMLYQLTDYLVRDTDTQD